VPRHGPALGRQHAPSIAVPSEAFEVAYRCGPGVELQEGLRAKPHCLARHAVHSNWSQCRSDRTWAGETCAVVSATAGTAKALRINDCRPTAVKGPCGSRLSRAHGK